MVVQCSHLICPFMNFMVRVQFFCKQENIHLKNSILGNNYLPFLNQIYRRLHQARVPTRNIVEFSLLGNLGKPLATLRSRTRCKLLFLEINHTYK